MTTLTRPEGRSHPPPSNSRIGHMPVKDEGVRALPLRGHFVLSVNNDGFDDLETRKLYQGPSTVKLRGMANIPVVDETDEDYISFRVVRARQLAWDCHEMSNIARRRTRDHPGR